MDRPISIEEMKTFSNEHYIEIPKRHFLEPKFLFERRFYNWRSKISTWIERYETLMQLYYDNLNSIKEFVDLIGYLALDINDYLPVPEIDFNEPDIMEFLELAIEEQKGLNDISLYSWFLTSGLKEKAIYKFFNEAIKNMPTNTSIVIVKASKEDFNTTTGSDCYPTQDNIAEFKSNLEKLKANPSKHCVYIPYLYNQCIWIAFVPNAFTQQELQTLCNTIKFGGNLLSSTVMYL